MRWLARVRRSFIPGLLTALAGLTSTTPVSGVRATGPLVPNLTE